MIGLVLLQISCSTVYSKPIYMKKDDVMAKYLVELKRWLVDVAFFPSSTLTVVFQCAIYFQQGFSPSPFSLGQKGLESRLVWSVELVLLIEVLWNTCQKIIFNCSHTQPRVKLTPKKHGRGSRGRRAQQAITSYTSVTTSRGPKRKSKDSETVSYLVYYLV